MSVINASVGLGVNMTKYLREHKQLIQAISFWALLVFLVGFASGLGVSVGIWKYKSKEVTRVGAVLIDNEVYKVEKRP